jgi:hypothetical protein
MGFDLTAFDKAHFSDRQESVPLPALAAFFLDGEEPLWTVRGLTHAELSRAAVAIQAGQNLEAVIEALTGDAKAKAGAIKQLLGVADGDVPQETKKRLEHLVMGSVDPEITLDIAVKLSVTFPIEFGQLTNKILELTGKGQVQAEVKRKPSGK